GSFVGSVKLERWRSHRGATDTEGLPDRKSTGWQTRTLDFYSGAHGSGGAMSLWDWALSWPYASSRRPPWLSLWLHSSDVELPGHLLALEAPLRVSLQGRGDLEGDGEVLFFRVSIDPAELAEFRSHDPADTAGNGKASRGSAFDGSSWQAFYSFGDEE